MPWVTERLSARTSRTVYRKSNAERRGLQVQRLRGSVEANDQRGPNGTLYKRFWRLIWDRHKNEFDWTINDPKYLFDDEECLAFAEAGVSGR